MSKIKNAPTIVNGDTVIGFTSTQKAQELGWVDLPSLASWYQEDPDKNHLGLIELFSSQADYRMPTYKKFFKDKAVLEVNGVNGRFTYDLPVVKPTGTFTVEDTSDYSDYPGLDETVFPIVLDKPYQPGDVLTYNIEYGQQIVVSEDHEVERNGDTYKHWVQVVGMDGETYYEKEFLRDGIQYFKFGHSLGEFSTQFSNIESPDNVGTLTCEFELAGHRGVETFYTMYANEKKFSGAAMHSKQFWNNFITQQEQMGKDEKGRPLDMMVIGKVNSSGKMIKDQSTIGSTLEYLVLLELMKLEAHQLLFQRPGIIRNADGAKKLNEGAWHQFRRGNIIKYSRKGGIQKSHIRQAMAILFQNRKDLLPQNREVTFDCGYFAYMNMMALFREEVIAQLQGLQIFMGMEKFLPKSPITGSSLTSLEMEPVMFTAVNIPEIGKVRINHDPSLDYSPMADRRTQGFYGEGGYSHTSYSMVIWDATDTAYSNARTNLPSGAKLVDGGAQGANVYYVRPEGENMWWGYSNGRYSPNTGRDIMSAQKTMSREFWAHNISACWVKDPSRSIIIELEEVTTAFRRVA